MDERPTPDPLEIELTSNEAPDGTPDSADVVVRGSSDATSWSSSTSPPAR